MKKIIGLFGLTFNSGNLGCCALAYGFCNLLKEVYGNNYDLYIFYENNEFKPELGNIKIETINYSYKSIRSLKNLNNKIKQCDIIFDFTEGDSFSDIYGIKRLIKVSLSKLLAIMNKVPLFLGPQTYGPYNKAISKSIFKHIAKKSKFMCTRDLLSAKLVEELTGRKIDTYTDVAFCLPYNKNGLASEKKKIGINVSGLLWNGGYNGKNQFELTTDYKKYTTTIIEYLLNNNYEIHLIGHVITKQYENLDNDLQANDAIKKIYPEVICAPKFKDPIEAKSYISNMDLFIGARMHATIGAFSSKVPTIPFSYSKKFEGLYNSLNYPYVIHGKKDDTQTSINKTIEYIENVNKLRENQINSEKEFNTQIDKFKKTLLNALEGI